jgi:hypothetical protein
MRKSERARTQPTHAIRTESAPEHVPGVVRLAVAALHACRNSEVRSRTSTVAISLLWAEKVPALEPLSGAQLLLEEEVRPSAPRRLMPSAMLTCQTPTLLWCTRTRARALCDSFYLSLCVDSAYGAGCAATCAGCVAPAMRRPRASLVLVWFVHWWI